MGMNLLKTTPYLLVVNELQITLSGTSKAAKGVNSSS